jgi:hypothetical protein
LTRSVHRHTLADEPRQFGERIVSGLTARPFRTVPRLEIAVRTVIAFNHKVRPAQVFTAEKET